MSHQTDVFLTLSSRTGFSAQELHAMVLDGELAVVSDAYALIDAPASPAVKAIVVTLSNVTRYAPCGHSALWVHGITEPPHKHSIALISGIRANHETLDRRRVRELRNIESQLVTIQGIPVQSPVWALIDVAKDHGITDQVKLDVIKQACLFDHQLCVESTNILQDQRSRPNAMLALKALALAHAVDVVDGINTTHGIQHTFEVHGVTHFKDESTERQAIIGCIHGGRQDIDMVLREHARHVRQKS